jgi:phosphoglycerol transferase MdoB-like AlkP superfamily enzyme
MGAVAVAAKASHWSLPEAEPKRLREYAIDVGVSAHADVLFALCVFVVGSVCLRVSAGRPALRPWLWRAYLAFCLVAVVFAVASVQIFAYLRSPLTYALVYLADNMSNMRSSIGAFVSARLAAALVAAPLLWALATAWSLGRPERPPTVPRRVLQAALLLAVLAYVGAGRALYEGRWHDRADHLIARSPHWALASSFAVELTGLGDAATFAQSYPKAALDDFHPPPKGRPSASLLPSGARPRNALVVVLESVGAHYVSLYGSRYDTTPTLVAESANALVDDAFYCHAGLTANSEAALTLSIYPYMTWREYTIEYPEMPGETLADVLQPRGYRTAFIHSGDLDYTNQRAFLGHRGFDVLWDWRDLGAPMVSSWGSHDGALVDGVLRFIDQDPSRPFYVCAWTTQAHHPYEPAPGAPVVDFFAEGPLPPDDYDLGRYLNTIRYTDGELRRLFDGLRQRGLAEDTVMLITGDHGEAFGEPHDAWGHGSRVYEENVRVPAMIWSPRLFPKGRRAQIVGGHVDVNPTVADALGVTASPSWRGRSLFRADRTGRAYFYAANDDYLLGVREGKWKYIYDATGGRDELYDLEADAGEARNLARSHQDLCRALRQRLAAWRDDTGAHLAAIRASRAAAH